MTGHQGLNCCDKALDGHDYCKQVAEVVLRKRVWVVGTADGPQVLQTDSLQMKTLDATRDLIIMPELALT